tara:strand:+ start:1175 stop:2593 length:1419 start_codon:yes stop_codon:yes gene_type:complete
MLSNLRIFSKSKLAGVLVAIIIVPFVFWGMGSVFQTGNTNNVVKINNETVSTKEFVNHINQSGLSLDYIRQNLDKNILEEMLSELVSDRLLKMEIEELNVNLSEKNLAKLIKSNKKFNDDDKKFSRLKYEKFLLEQNISAYEFEKRFKNNELKNNLFNYISGGIKSPYFLKNKIFVNETKKLDIDYFDIENSYNILITDAEIIEFINDNEELLKEDFIDFSFTKITPKNLIEIDEFNNDFFKRIDEIENEILNEKSIQEISKKFNLTLEEIKDYKFNEESDLFKEIYSKRSESKIKLIDKEDYYLLYEIFKLNKVLPDKNNIEFVNKVKKNLIVKKKYDFIQKLFEQIKNKELNDSKFVEIAKGKQNIKNTLIESINDTKYFDIKSLKLLYELSKGSFVLIGDANNKIYLAKINNINASKLLENSENSSKYLEKSNLKIVSDLYGSYDLSLNSKYKVKVFQKSIDRVKEYFR